MNPSPYNNLKIPSFLKGDVCLWQTGGFSTNLRFINNLHSDTTNYTPLRVDLIGVATWQSRILRDKRQEVRDKRIVLAGESNSYNLHSESALDSDITNNNRAESVEQRAEEIVLAQESFYYNHYSEPKLDCDFLLSKFILNTSIFSLNKYICGVVNYV